MKGILFNQSNVQAILDGRKTVTRRLVKPQPDYIPESARWAWPVPKSTVREGCCTKVYTASREWWQYLSHEQFPYQGGDILYVRETWCEVPYESDTIPIKGGHVTMPKYAYKATSKIDYSGTWRPSIHMPKEAARIFLRVTGVRVERLQDITEEEANAEGLKAYGQNNCSGTSARIAFAELWDSTLPPNKNKFKCPENEWRSNPWVWVIEFERVSKEEAEKE